MKVKLDTSAKVNVMPMRVFKQIEDGDVKNKNKNSVDMVEQMMEPEHHIKLKEDISPKVHPPRKIPASLWEKVKEELVNMEKAGMIRKIDKPTE